MFPWYSVGWYLLDNRANLMYLTYDQAIMVSTLDAISHGEETATLAVRQPRRWIRTPRSFSETMSPSLINKPRADFIAHQFADASKHDDDRWSAIATTTNCIWVHLCDNRPSLQKVHTTGKHLSPAHEYRSILLMRMRFNCGKQRTAWARTQERVRDAVTKLTCWSHLSG